MFLVMAALVRPDPTPPPPVDPLTVEIEAEDVERFAALFERSGGKVAAKMLQQEYLDPGSYGVHVFTPSRIQNAGHLANRVAANPELYSKAIRTCLPIVMSTTAELRSTYLALAGLFPGMPLPHIYLVIGADTSGGTAGPGAQVLGLETPCRIADTPEKLSDIMRAFYAHETVHALQKEQEESTTGGVLLRSVLAEGAADFIAALVTGRPMDPARAAWAAPREAELWRQFEADLAVTRSSDRGEIKRGTPEGSALYRWVGNYGSAPEGWPGELGYWMGERIWQRWYEKQPDKRAALQQMLSLAEPLEVLAAGRLEK